MRKTTILIFVLLAGCFFLTSCGMEIQKDSATNPNKPAPPAVQSPAQPVPAPPNAASDQTLIQEKLNSFEKQAEYLKWAITTALVLLFAAVGFVSWKNQKEYDKSLADVKDALKDAKESCREAKKCEEEARETCENIKKLADEAKSRNEEGQKLNQAYQAGNLGQFEKAAKLWEELSQKYRERYYGNKTNENKDKLFCALTNWGTALSCWAGDIGGLKANNLYRLACERYQEAAEIEPNDHYVFYNWGNVLFRWADLGGPEAENLYRLACEKCQKTICLKPDFYWAFINWSAALLGWAQLKKDKQEREALYQEAKDVLLNAETIKLGSGAFNLACVFALCGDENECQKWLKIGEKVSTLPIREHAMRNKAIADMREKPWFKAIRWKGE